MVGHRGDVRLMLCVWWDGGMVVELWWLCCVWCGCCVDVEGLIVCVVVVWCC